MYGQMRKRFSEALEFKEASGIPWMDRANWVYNFIESFGISRKEILKLSVKERFKQAECFIEEHEIDGFDYEVYEFFDLIPIMEVLYE